MADAQRPTIEISVIAPAHNEAENVVRLIEEVGGAFADSGLAFEFVLVDDASTDGTPDLAREAGQGWVRVVSLGVPEGGGGNGQSAAFRAGFAAARGELLSSLDADLQNDPKELVRMVGMIRETGADMVQGDRSAARAGGDAFVRRFGSIVGRTFRRWILGDTIRDTGCSLRVFRREIGGRLPLEFKGAHRFIPVSARQMGYTVVETPVSHRSRHAGTPKYGAGLLTRALPGLVDCFAVRWMGNRRRTPVVREQTSDTGSVRESVHEGAA